MHPSLPLSRHAVALVLAGLLAASPVQAMQDTPHGEHWVGTWAASPMGFPNASGTLPETTLREIVHVSLGGAGVRVVLSNEFGTESLTVAGAQIAPAAANAAASKGSIDPPAARPLTFGGQPEVVIPAGADALSDPVAMQLPGLSDLAVTLFLPAQPAHVVTAHSFADQINYEAAGNQLNAAALVDAKTFVAWRYLKDVEVMAGPDAGAIVAFGDSITDGALSTRDANARWPDVLAKRLAADKKTAQIGILNQGIGGNRLLHNGTGPNALARLDRDVLAQPGAKYLIVLEGINDIGHTADPKQPFDPVTAQQLTFSLAQIADRAHAHGLKVIGATLTPYMGTGYSSPAGEILRVAENEFIRHSSKFDAVIDFDKITQDAAKADTLRPAYDSGDHLHPKDAGYKAMGEAIDLGLFVGKK